MAYSSWTTKQVSALSKLGYQVADKGVASVLVELHNRRIFEAGLVVVGTLAYMSWLNEYGAMATAAGSGAHDLARALLEHSSREGAGESRADRDAAR